MKKTLVFVITILFVSNIAWLIYCLRLRNVCNEYAMSAISNAYLSGAFKAELDFCKGKKTSFQKNEDFENEIDKATWDSYLKSYNRKYDKLSNPNLKEKEF